MKSSGNTLDDVLFQINPDVGKTDINYELLMAGFLARYVEPLVGRIEFRRGNEHDLHLSQGSMPGPRMNYHGCVNRYRNDFAIDFHGCIRLAFEEEIRFRDPLVIVDLGIDGDLCQMKRVGHAGHIQQCPFGCSAGAGNTS